ncbi:hypothetical protein CCACVL1_10157, partial [Corchorus capsularis]
VSDRQQYQFRYSARRTDTAELIAHNKEIEIRSLKSLKSFNK